jgi:hypothetical protein
VEQTAEPQTVTYSVGEPDGASFSFVVPGTDEKVRFSYYSCNGVQKEVHADALDKKGGAWKMWDDLAAEHAANPFHVLLGGGDDLYIDTDALWALPELSTVLTTLDTTRNTELSVCGAIADGTFIRTFLFNRVTGFGFTAGCSVLPDVAKCAGGKRILDSFLSDQMSSRLCALTRASEPDRFAKLEEELKAFFFHMYVRQYAVGAGSFGSSLASIPSLKVWDDHDIIDGWGDYSAEVQRCEIFQLIYDISRQMYLLFQHQTYEELTNTSFGFEDNNLFGKSRASDPQFSGGGANFLHKIGPTTVLGIDCRSEREYFEQHPGANRVWTDATTQLIFDKLRSTPRAEVENQHLLVMLGSPLAIPSGKGAERAISCVPALCLLPAGIVATINWCTFDALCAGCEACGICDVCVSKRGLNWFVPELLLSCCGVVGRSSLTFQPELIDDFQDGWHAAGVSRQRDQLVKGLQDFAEESRTRVTFLSGDVHFATSAVIKRANYNRDCFSNPVFCFGVDSVCCALTCVLQGLGCNCCNMYCCRPCAPQLADAFMPESDHVLMHQFVSSPMANLPTMPPLGLACCSLREMSHEASCTSGSHNKINPCGEEFALVTENIRSPNCCDCSSASPHDYVTVAALTKKGTFDPLQLSDLCCCQDALFRERNWLELEADYAKGTDLRVALHVETEQPSSRIWAYPPVPALSTERTLVPVDKPCCLNLQACKHQLCHSRCCFQNYANPAGRWPAKSY